ncbi:MAG: hypothetical protein ACXW0T_12105 [Methylobacter sp.]
MKIAILSTEDAVKIGFHKDKRKRRRQHRKQADFLLKQGGFFNTYSASGSIFWDVAMWHKSQARGI